MSASAYVVLALALGAPAAGADESMPQTSWMPLKVGTAWHYRAGDAKILLRIAAHEKVGDVVCARLETVREGKVIGSEHLRVSSDGLYRVDADVYHDNQVHRQTLEPPILLLLLPPKSGQTFSVKSTVDGKEYKGTFKVTAEEVKVPAGTYKAMAVSSQDLEVEGIHPQTTTWYAENVGMVKKLIAAGKQKVEIVLEKFEPGK